MVRIHSMGMVPCMVKADFLIAANNPVIADTFCNVTKGIPV
jgi:hypothetical protein